MYNSYYHIFVMGGPGTGKDAFARLIAANSARKFIVMSPGSILREMPGYGTEKYDFISDIIGPWFDKHTLKGDYIFAGFPRDAAQVDYYFELNPSEYNIRPILVNLNADDETMIARMIERGRKFDINNAGKRIAQFNRNIPQIMDRFRINGVMPSRPIFVNGDAKRYATAQWQRASDARGLLKSHGIPCGPMVLPFTDHVHE